jgi:hypothetical protein
MPTHHERIEAGIMLATVEGLLRREDFIEAAHQRRAFADQHNENSYVLIYDLRKALIRDFDVRVSRWGVEFDPRLKYTVIIGNSTLVRVIVNILLKLTQQPIEFADSTEEALEKARAYKAKLLDKPPE